MKINSSKITKFILPALLFAGCAEIIEKSLTNEQVMLSAPANNVASSDSLQTFYWQKLDGATSYQLQVVSPNFDSIVKLIADTTVNTNMFPISLDTGQYQWKVRAFNASSTTLFSGPWTLTIH
jgi:hypothetical protein